MGEHYLGELTERERRIATSFAGGIGGTEKELCGVVTMGVAVIGALYGRTQPDGDDQEAQELTARFRQRFLEQFGYLRCGELRESGYGSDREEPCSMLVERGARILIEVIEEHRQGQD